MRHFREIKKVLYKLKRQFGTPCTMLAETYSTDFATGVQATTVTYEQTVNRAIVLPRGLTRVFSYDLSFIAANKNFTYGGLYDINTRNIIIDAGDVTGFDPQIPNIIVIASRRYNIKSAEKYDVGNRVAAYHITAIDSEAQPDV